MRLRQRLMCRARGGVGCVAQAKAAKAKKAKKDKEGKDKEGKDKDKQLQAQQAAPSAVVATPGGAVVPQAGQAADPSKK